VTVVTERIVAEIVRHLAESHPVTTQHRAGDLHLEGTLILCLWRVVDNVVRRPTDLGNVLRAAPGVTQLTKGSKLGNLNSVVASAHRTIASRSLISDVLALVSIDTGLRGCVEYNKSGGNVACTTLPPLQTRLKPQQHHIRFTQKHTGCHSFHLAGQTEEYYPQH
jgi:hypothetical protein